MIVNGLAALIRRWSIPVEVVKRTAPTAVNGRFAAPEESRRTIRAHVQPVSGRELQRLPEGLRDRFTIRVWTDAELRIADQTLPDLLLYNDSRFEVQTSQPWQQIAGFFEYLATKEPT